MEKNEQKQNNNHTPEPSKNDSEPQNTPQKVEFKSGKEYCELCKNEYNSERNRTSVIDSKTNIVLSFSAVFFVALTQAINLAKLLKIEITTIGNLILPILTFILIIGALILTLTAIILFAKVICTHKYLIIELEDFYTTQSLSANPNDFAIALAHSYKDAAAWNYNVNTKRTNLYNKGLILLIVSISLFACYMCLISFI